MIPVLGIPYISRSDLFLRAVTSINHPVQDIIVVDNSPGDSVPVIDQAIYIKMGRNMGVAWAWNTIIKRMPQAPWWVIMNADLRLGLEDLSNVRKAMENGLDLVMIGSMALFGISARCIDKVGWFDENFVPAYCLVPETLVLTDDLRWVSIGSLAVGDGLVGVDEAAGSSQRRFRRSYVTAISNRIAECVRVTLVDGREVVCTKDHRWLSKTPIGGMPWEWRETSVLHPGWRLQVPIDTWRTASTFGEGWLSGVLDGEGCLHKTSRTVGIDVSQKPGPVLDRIFRELQMMSIPYTWRLRRSQDGHDPVAQVEISGRRKAMELIGRLRPERLQRPELWDGRSPRSRIYPNAVPIESITEVGTTDVITIETTTRTFIANGITSHNCEDNDYIYRCSLLGAETLWMAAGWDHFGSATIKSDPVAKASNDCSYPLNVKYYQAKWGGLMGHETFKTPFDMGGSPRDCPTLDLDRLRGLSWD